jgi:excisionase family DNA binding protein
MSLKDNTLFLNGISLEEFESIITNAVRKEMQPHLQKLSENKESKREELLSKKEAANFLRMSLPTLSKLVKDGVIQCSRIGGSLRFKKSQLEKSIEQTQSRKFSIPIANTS